MSDTQINYFETAEVAERTQQFLFDFDRIQVAPQPRTEPVEFNALSLSERQTLLEKLINRVKSL
jgi:hypothetical protein